MGPSRSRSHGRLRRPEACRHPAGRRVSSHSAATSVAALPECGFFFRSPGSLVHRCSHPLCRSTPPAGSTGSCIAVAASASPQLLLVASRRALSAGFFHLIYRAMGTKQPVIVPTGAIFSLPDTKVLVFVPKLAMSGGNSQYLACSGNVRRASRAAGLELGEARGNVAAAPRCRAAAVPASHLRICRPLASVSGAAWNTRHALAFPLFRLALHLCTCVAL